MCVCGGGGRGEEGGAEGEVREKRRLGRLVKTELYGLIKLFTTLIFLLRASVSQL